MEKLSPIALGALLSLLSCAEIKAGEKIIFVSDPYPPYVIDGGHGKGYVTDMVLLIFKKAGFEAEYKNVPFKRALAEIERGNFTGLLALSPGREKYLFTENSMGYFKNQFFVRADSTWKWDGRSSLEKVVFGGILGYRFDKEFIDPHVEKFKGDPERVQLIAGQDALQRNIVKMTMGRIDVIFDDSLAIAYAAKEAGVKDKIRIADVDDQLKSKKLFESKKVSVGFHSSNPKAAEYIKILDDGIKEIKKSGEFREILLKYGLENYVQQE